MTLTINLEGNNYINVESYKSGNNPTFRDVIIIDKHQLLANTEESLNKIREWSEKK
jgi:hypothetical protein